MKVYFDTNVLVSALKSEHVHHRASFAAFQSVKTGTIVGVLSSHGLAELYSVLTRTPFTTRVHPEEVPPMVRQSILPSFHVIEASTESHLAAIDRCAKSGWKGGRIHDAVHIQAALQAECDLIYTYNLSDFHDLAPEMASQIQAPPSPPTS